MKYLYVTWDAPHATYLESLFLPIFERLDATGIHLDVLQFTWGDALRSGGAAEACRRAGIGYEVRPINRGWAGAGPFLTAGLGSRHVLSNMRRFKSDAVLARSTMPAIAVLCAARRTTFPFVFDADGLPIDERVEFAGLSPFGPTHRLLRLAEAQMVRRSAAILVRTRAAREVLLTRAGSGTPREKFHIVTNGRDPAMFAPSDERARAARRASVGIGDAPVLVYSGSLGGGKYLLNEMLLFFQAFRKAVPSAIFLILTPQQAMVEEVLKTEAFRDLATSCILMSVAPGDVPALLGIADAGVAPIAPTMSMKAAAPIKTAEYLLCGLPVLGTGAVGDNEPGIEAGVFQPVDFSDPASRRNGVEWLMKRITGDRSGLRALARNVGTDNFSLDASARQYRKALLL